MCKSHTDSIARVAIGVNVLYKQSVIDFTVDYIREPVILHVIFYDDYASSI